MVIGKNKDRRASKERSILGNRRGGFFSMIIEPYRQIKLSLMILALNILFGLSVGLVVYYYIADIHGAVSGYCLLDAVESQETWAKFLKPIIVILSLVFVFFGLSFVIIIIYTHQIYGPLVSIHRYLDHLASGDKIKPLSVRSSDQLVTLARKLDLIGKYLSNIKEYKGIDNYDQDIQKQTTEDLGDNSSNTDKNDKNKNDKNDNKVKKTDKLQDKKIAIDQTDKTDDQS